MILNSYNVEDAKKVLLNTDHKINIVGVDEVFYPYILMMYSVFVGKGRLSKLNKLCSCVIDGVSGSTYEGKGSPTMIDVEIDEAKSLVLQVAMDDWRKIGHNFVLKQFIEKAKLLMAPAIQTIVEEIFYKKFYIMHCLDEEKRDYFIMVDAVDGGISILDYNG